MSLIPELPPVSRLKALLWASSTLGGILFVCVIFLFAIDYKWTIVVTEHNDPHHREDQCEALHEDSIVLEPQNTWSNVGYLFAGLLILYRTRTLRGITIGAFLCVTGITSGLYHAVPINSTLQHLDVSSIYWLLLVTIAYALFSVIRHYTANDPPVIFEKLVIPVAIVIGTFVEVPRLIDSTVAVLIMVLVLLGFVVAGMWPPSRELSPLSYREMTGYLLGMIILGGFSAIFRLLDGDGRILCDPHGPFQFHGMWHMFSAALLLLSYDLFTRMADQPHERLLAD